MKKLKIKLIGLLAVGAIFTTSCLNDLETEPKYELTLEQLLQRDPNAIGGLLSRMYSTFALSSVNGPGSSDIAGADPGESPFIRGLVNLNDFTADGMKNRWGDNGLDQLTTTSGWTSNNKFFKYVYDRIYYTVPQTTNLILILKNKVDIPNEDQAMSELRFLRALSYYYLVDFFGKGALITDDNFGTTAPVKESSRAEIFAYVESELKAIEDSMPATNTYGRANKAAVQMLLAKLYLNAQVYTGTARNADAAAYAKKVIDGGQYQLETNFIKNFRADNNTSKEIIFPLIADAQTSQSYGNTTYIVMGSLSPATMTPATYGADGGWGGHRATKAWYGLFGNNAAALAASTDQRAKLFWTSGHQWEMNDYKTWEDGYPSIKFTHQKSDGSTLPLATFSSTDFPLFRLADAYLMYAEAVLRGAADAGTSQGNALALVNKVRARAGIAALSAITLQDILDERGRELNLEGQRRQDLIRFGMFTGGSYLWPWKGGVKDGVAIPAGYKVFPIPTSALQANTNLTQNEGY